jgi:hypothetical protein
MQIVHTDNRLITADCDSGKRQTRPLVRESGPHQQTCNCLTVIKIWSSASDEGFIPRQTGRLTVGRNINLTLTSSLQSLTQSTDRHRSRHFNS